MFLCECVAKQNKIQICVQQNKSKLQICWTWKKTKSFYSYITGYIYIIIGKL